MIKFLVSSDLPEVVTASRPPWPFNTQYAHAFLLGVFLTIAPTASVAQLGRAKLTHQTQAGHALQKPAVIYVTDFALDPGQLQSSNPVQEKIQQGGALRQRLNQFRGQDSSPEGRAQSLVNLMADSIVRDLQEKQLSAQRYSVGRTPRTGWIVKGRYKTLEQGNRVASSEIGFGAGSPVVEVEVTLDEIRNGKQRPILLFGTNKEDSRAPGGAALAAATHNPYAMAIKFVRSRNDLEKSVKQTAKLIADQIARKAGV